MSVRLGKRFLSVFEISGQKEPFFIVNTFKRVSHAQTYGESARIRNFRHDKLSTYAIGGEYSRTEWRAIFRQLVAMGLLVVDVAGHGGLHFGPDSRAVLRGERRVERSSQLLVRGFVDSGQLEQSQGHGSGVLRGTAGGECERQRRERDQYSVQNKSSNSRMAHDARPR
ncbi:MAG: hypothetical protein IH790_00340 [Acidobacteria bacterium]|nr:hypothetical protein [Acidobacteriota bacterium]